MSAAAKRVRVFFINCPTLATDAASYLILSQNAVQESVQFETYHHWIYSLKSLGKPAGWWKLLNDQAEKGMFFRSWADRTTRKKLDLRAAPDFTKPLTLGQWEAICTKAIAEYDAWLQIRESRRHDVQSSPAIIVTETEIEGGYISFAGTNIGVVSTANWERYFKPISALEYILTSVQRLSLRIAICPKLGSHYPTRGCIWDYVDHQPDARIGILMGSLCETCRNRLKASMKSDKAYDDVIKLIGSQWIGDKSDLSSVSATLAKVYGYDLTKSTGLRPSWWSFVSQSFLAEFGKRIAEAFKWPLVILLFYLFSTKIPWVADFLKNQL